MTGHRIFGTAFAKVYPMYVQKAETKSRSRDEVADGVDFEAFFAQAPALHPNTALITGTVCGVRVEDPLMRKIRWLDKLVDELAKGRPLEKILR